MKFPFGFLFISEREAQLQQELADAKIASLTSEISALKEYVRKCEGLIDHERGRIDSERERADRIADSLFQSNGLPATSATVLAEQQRETERSAEARKTYIDELAEIYGESMDELVEEGLAAPTEPVGSAQ